MFTLIAVAGFAQPGGASVHVQAVVETLQVLPDANGGTLYLEMDQLFEMTLPMTHKSVPQVTIQGDPASNYGALVTTIGPPTLYAMSNGAIVKVGSDGLLTPFVGGHVRSASDVDDDGREDLCTSSLVLTHEPDFLVLPYPNPAPDPSWGRHVCIPDLNGDGYADLLQVHDTEFFTFGWIPIAVRSTVYLHLGGPDGYKEGPDWTFLADMAVHTALPVQADSDPELELLLAGGNVDGYGYDNPTRTFQVLDDVRAPRPTSAFVTADVVADRRDRFGFAQVQNVGDLDGDGMDEVAVCVHTYHSSGLVSEHGDLRVLNALEGFHSDRPLFQLHFEAPLPGRWGTNPYGYCSFGFLDVDLDGDLDAYAYAHSGQGSDPALVQVWYGPLYEPPEPLPHTGDTGIDHTGHTGLTGTENTATTGDTALPQPTHAPPPAQRRCGCAQGGQGAWLPLFVLVPLFRRRA